MEIRLHITEEKLDALTFRDIRTLMHLADGGLTAKDFDGLHNVIAQLIVDESGAPMELELARARVDDLTRKQIRQVLEQLNAKFGELAVNPTNAGAS
jgi:hypothetical protein